SRLKKAATRSRPSVWCELSQLQARRLILKVGLGRDLVPRDLPTAKNPNRLCETLTSMLKASCVKRLEGYEIHLRGIVRPRLPRAEKRWHQSSNQSQIGSAKEIKGEAVAQKNYHGKGLAPKILEGKKTTEKIGTRATERPRIR
ncbi:unnamed protein product, partial [Laminaria digitata]